MMINHARTLLMNRPGDTRPAPTFFLEEFVDPAFRALTLPSYLSELHRTLTGGATADNAWANFRMHQYVDILHATEFEEYVTALDPRVTYTRDRSVIDQLAEETITPLEGPTTSIHTIGTLTPAQQRPQLRYAWEIEMVSALEVRVTNQRTSKSAVSAITVTNGLSEAVPLIGQDELKIAIENPSAGARWLLEAFAPPPQDLGSLVSQLRATGSVTLGKLFGREEPFATFKQLWDDHALMSYRLSGLLLAFIYRVEDIRVGGSS